MPLTPEEQALWEKSTGKPYQSSGFMDYIPNVFGSVPPGYQGLLGEDLSQQIGKRSNFSGLLGAAAALSQGMSGQGPRRGALQNILGALGAGYGASGQAYQGGIEQMMNAQKFAQSKIDLSRQQQARDAVEKIIASPEVANNAGLVAYFRANPEKALDRYISIQETQAARGITPTAPPNVPPNAPQNVASQPSMDAGVNVFPPVVVNESQYGKQLRQAESANTYFSNIGNIDRAKAAREEADNLRGLIRQEELANSVTQSLTKIHPMLQGVVDTLNINAPSMSASEIQSNINKIREKDSDFRLSAETDLRKEFSQQPIVKEYSTVETAYKTISNALSNPSAANDLAAATKFMKLLDPGSVVRESEFAMAAGATGVFDRVGNYFQRLQNGQVLNPSQRADFKKSADLIYQAAQQNYNQTANQFKLLAENYNLNPDNVVLTKNKLSEKTDKNTSVLPSRNSKGYILSTDANGNRAYVSPDGSKFEEVK